MRRIAAHIMTINGIEYMNHVIELDSDDSVIRHYPLTHELPQTEWRNRYDK